MSRKADEYRRNAELCLRMARDANNEKDRAVLLEISQHWTSMAQQAEVPHDRRIDDQQDRRIDDQNVIHFQGNP